MATVPRRGVLMDRTVPRDPRLGGTIADAAAPCPQRFAPPAPHEPVALTCEKSFEVGAWALPWSPTACGLARTAVRDVLPRWGLGELVPAAELLVSELVCNALRHAAGPLHLTLEPGPDVRCSVSDGSLEPPRPTEAGPEDEGGRGLALVDMLAARWGCESGPRGKTVWFELPVHADTLDVEWMDALDDQNAPWRGESGLDRLVPLKGDWKGEAA
ncbi:ATP-binding protein [Streptomyces sp. NPDC001530]|uniref:ATP-binding protein n=1 Tax=Streptomyces sp. NPDC001530 TaxID=3364582 RepID=UPI0036B10BAF